MASRRLLLLKQTIREVTIRMADEQQINVAVELEDKVHGDDLREGSRESQLEEYAEVCQSLSRAG